MTRTFVAAAAGLAMSLVSASAWADPPPVKVLRTVTVIGKRQLPTVVIEIARLNATTEASAAHETLHAALVKSTAP